MRIDTMSMMLPAMMMVPNQSLQSQRLIENSLGEYTDWENIKRQLAFQTALSSNHRPEGGAANPLVNAAVTYGTLTIGETVLKGYNRLLSGVKKRLPALEEFENRHPIIGKSLLWGPGLLASGLGVVVAKNGFKTITRQGSVQSLLRNPALARWGLLIVSAASILTSLGGVLLRKQVGLMNESGRQYRQLRMHYPDMSPSELKRMNELMTNRQYYYARQQQQRQQLQAELGLF